MLRFSVNSEFILCTITTGNCVAAALHLTVNYGKRIGKNGYVAFVFFRKRKKGACDALEMLGYSCVVLFIVLVCNTNGREITSSSYLDCNAFDSVTSRETCATANLYFHEIFETVSEEYFWAPYSYSDDIATPRTNKDSKSIRLLLKDVAQHWQTFCLDGRISSDCGKKPDVNAEDSLVTGTTFWRKSIPLFGNSYGDILANSRDDVLSLDKFVEETRNLTDRQGDWWRRKTGILAEIESNLWKTYQQLDFAAQKTKSSAQLEFLLREDRLQEFLNKGLPRDLFPGYMQTLANLEGITARERFSTRVARLGDIIGHPNPYEPSYLERALQELHRVSAPQRNADLLKNYPEIAMTLCIPQQHEERRVAWLRERGLPTGPVPEHALELFIQKGYPGNPMENLDKKEEAAQNSLSHITTACDSVDLTPRWHKTPWADSPPKVKVKSPRVQKRPKHLKRE